MRQQLWSKFNHKFTDDGRVQIHQNSPGDILSVSSRSKEGAEGIISSSNGLVTGNLTIGLDPMLQAVKLPGRTANLETSLNNEK